MPVAFMGILHQPTKQRLDLKRVSRLVVLPDYQGIGIGRYFLDAIAQMYIAEGHMFEIKTSARNLIGSLRTHPESKFAQGGGRFLEGRVLGVQPQSRQDGNNSDEPDAQNECQDGDVRVRRRGMSPFRLNGGGGYGNATRGASAEGTRTAAR